MNVPISFFLTFFISTCSIEFIFAFPQELRGWFELSPERLNIGFSLDNYDIIHGSPTACKCRENIQVYWFLSCVVSAAEEALSREDNVDQHGSTQSSWCSGR